MTTHSANSRQRVLTLQGGCNFRDIGGYTAANGQTVKWQRVYRTGVLSYFTAEDHPILEGLSIRSICDLRRGEEREREPTRWPNNAVHLLSWEDNENMPMIRRFAAQRPATAAGMHDSMIDLYTALPSWMGQRMRGFFECIANDNTPMIVHCAAGKDRTGIAVAVLLKALGVSDETIIADYLLTNDTASLEEFLRARKEAQLGLGDAQAPLMSLPPDIRKVLFSANSEFLDAAIKQMQHDFGSIDSYLERCVELKPATIEKVRAALLE